MHRFVAFQWDAANEGAARQAERWSAAIRHASPLWAAVLDQPGFLVLSRAKPNGLRHAVPIGHDQGIVVGQIFARGREQNGSLSQLCRDEGPGTDLRHRLISGHWGAYVALWRESENGPVQILRDPSGAVACFSTGLPGVRLFCSFIDDVSRLPDIALSADWDTLRGYLLHSSFVTPHTGLKEVQELLPGQALISTIGQEPRVSWAWHGAGIAATPIRMGFEEACAAFRDTAEACFTAWSRSSSHTVVRLSGGLDSSTVACLLARTGARVTATHMVGRGYEAFEVAMARRTADHAGIALLELACDDPFGDVSRLVDGPALVRPSRQVTAAAASELMARVCREHAADSVMGGHGGDHVFLQRSIAADVLADYVRLHGPGRRLFSVAYDGAMLQEESIWQVLGRAFAVTFGARKWRALSFLDEDPARAQVFGASALPDAYMLHPWLADAVRLPPAKAEQLRGIVSLRDYYPVMGHGVDHDAIQPLMSQPILELALRTPAYLFTHGGIDRAIERTAFADLLPDEVVQRTHKGFVNHQLTGALSGHIGTLKEFLLDGHLVSHGVVGRELIERSFAPEQLARPGYLATALDLIAVEAWLTTWSQRPCFNM